MPSTSSLGIIVSASVYLLLVRLHRILPAANSFCIGLPCFAGIPLNAASTSKVKSSVSTIGLRDLLQVAFYSHFALVVLFVLAAAAIVVATALLALLRPVQHGIVELVASLTAITWCIYGLWLVCSRDSRFRAYSVLFVGFVIGMISGVLQARRLRDVVEVALDFITSVGFRTSLETSWTGMSSSFVAIAVVANGIVFAGTGFSAFFAGQAIYKPSGFGFIWGFVSILSGVVYTMLVWHLDSNVILCAAACGLAFIRVCAFRAAVKTHLATGIAFAERWLPNVTAPAEQLAVKQQACMPFNKFGIFSLSYACPVGLIIATLCLQMQFYSVGAAAGFLLMLQHSVLLALLTGELAGIALAACGIFLTT
eukprot:TRINITY_DN158_c0_g1_i10.p1 TRINITY_DN158_c0_g1~~TRINITY_DN158_c0_g1_i10.p1  ORF type:complete len:367 (-),score=42.21 TRINITY_DN158_c0_g1_i10:2473-3573(-)